MRIKKMKKLLCLVLVLGLLFSIGITTAYTGNSTTLSGSLPSSSYHYTLDEIVELFATPSMVTRCSDTLPSSIKAGALPTAIGLMQ